MKRGGRIDPYVRRCTCGHKLADHGTKGKTEVAGLACRVCTCAAFDDVAAHERVVREAVFARDGHRCLLHGHPLWWGPCLGALTFHHLYKAGQGGAYTEANGVTLCVHHNDEVENRPDDARALGLLVDRTTPPDEAQRRRWNAGLQQPPTQPGGTPCQQ